VDYQVYTLCRVDRSIRIAASVVMDIPMTYASLDCERSPFYISPGFVLDSGLAVEMRSE
jgi:hypothetical protein